MSKPKTKRPGDGLGSIVTTPQAETMLQLLGAGACQGGVAMTRDEWQAVKKLYRFRPEEPGEGAAMMQAGADRNALRHAEADGLRILAWIAKHVPAGEDPLKTVVQAVSAAGWDVAYEDLAWANDDEETDEEVA